MKFYKIIHDEAALKDFIEWLPELAPNEKFILSLFARKKYCNSLIKSSDKTQLRRFTSDKKRMIDKIRQLELPYGHWKLNEQVAPQESLVLYIMPNPRCMKKATELMGQKCWELMYNQNYDLGAESLSCIQKSKAKSVYVDFDIDSKNVDLSLLNNIFPNNRKHHSFNVLETRGGFHILVNPQQAKAARLASGMKINQANRWFQEVHETYDVDQCGSDEEPGDQFIPIPGCIQGGFIPKMLNI